jgi:general stress protein 26
MEQVRRDSIAKLKELTEGIDFCMLTTIDAGHLRSRPMSTQQFSPEGDLWFFTSDQTHKTDEIANDDRVNIAYSNPSDSTYVSVSGRAETVNDRAKMEELWSPVLKAWFPDGLDDPHLCLLKVSVEQAEYWEAASGTIVQIYGFVKALVMGESADWGENKKIEL